MLVWSLKNYRKQQTPAGTICHLMSCSQQCGPLHSQFFKGPQGCGRSSTHQEAVRPRGKKDMLSEASSALVSHTHVLWFTSLFVLWWCKCIPQHSIFKMECARRGGKKCDWAETGYQHQGHVFSAALKCDEVVTRYPDTLSQQKTDRRSRQHLHRQEHNTPQQADP